MRGGASVLPRHVGHLGARNENPPSRWATQLAAYPTHPRRHATSGSRGDLGPVSFAMDVCLSGLSRPPGFPGGRKPRRILRGPPVVCDLPSGRERGTQARPGGQRVACCGASLRGCVQRRVARSVARRTVPSGIGCRARARALETRASPESQASGRGTGVVRTAFGRSWRPTESGHLRVPRRRVVGCPSGRVRRRGYGSTFGSSQRATIALGTLSRECRAARKRSSLRAASEPSRQSSDLRVR